MRKDFVKDDLETVMFTEDHWLSPVESPDHLPWKDVRDRSMCYVQAENAVYRYTSGVWVLDAAKGEPED